MLKWWNRNKKAKDKKIADLNHTVSPLLILKGN